MRTIAFQKHPGETKKDACSYEVFVDGVSVGFLHREHYDGSGRARARYVGAWSSGFHWVFEPETKGDEGRCDAYVRIGLCAMVDEDSEGVKHVTGWCKDSFKTMREGKEFLTKHLANGTPYPGFGHYSVVP